MSWVHAWFRAFFLTLAVELAVAPWFLPKAEPRWRRAAAVVAANVASHPAVWFVFPALGFRYSVVLTLAELWAFGSEVLIYMLVFRGFSPRKAMIASALANGASLGVGVTLRALGVPL
jgi:hypothetical protein